MSTLWTLFRYEMRMVLRDTRTIIISVVLPFVLFPLFILISNFVEEREQRTLEEATYKYAIIGDREAWATYRQQLRDLPADPNWPDVDFPEPPN